MRRIARGAFEIAGHRMALAKLGEAGVEAAFGDVAARLRRQDGIERRAPDAGLARIIGTGGDQNRTAFTHIAGDVVEIDHRQHALTGIAVEDDELKLADLLLEQFARRESNQRQLVDRRAVLLLRRAQNGEMHEVDRSVRLEQVAPGPLAGIRLAGDQQHAQLVAHAVDGDHRAIVDGGELAGERRRFDLDDVGAAMRDRDIDALRGADRHRAGFHDLAVAADRHHGAALAGALILDLIGDGLRLADNAEARRGDQRHAAVAFILVAGNERMNRRREAERAGFGRHVVHAPVGNHNRAGDAVGGNVGERRAKRGEEPRAFGFAIRLAGLDHAQVEPGNAAQARDDRGPRFFRLPRAVAEILARTFIDHDDGDRAERVAVFAGQ